MGVCTPASAAVAVAAVAAVAAESCLHPTNIFRLAPLALPVRSIETPHGLATRD